MSLYERFCIESGRTVIHSDLYRRATVSESKFIRFYDKDAEYPEYAFGRAIAAALDRDEGAFVLVQRYRVASRALGTSWKIVEKGGMAVVPLRCVLSRCVALRARAAKTVFVSADKGGTAWPQDMTKPDADVLKPARADAADAAVDESGVEDDLEYDDDSVEDPYYNKYEDDPTFRRLQRSGSSEEGEEQER